MSSKSSAGLSVHDDAEIIKRAENMQVRIFFIECTLVNFMAGSVIYSPSSSCSLIPQRSYADVVGRVPLRWLYETSSCTLRLWPMMYLVTPIVL